MWPSPDPDCSVASFVSLDNSFFFGRFCGKAKTTTLRRCTNYGILHLDCVTQRLLANARSVVAIVQGQTDNQHDGQGATTVLVNLAAVG